MDYKELLEDLIYNMAIDDTDMDRFDSTCKTLREIGYDVEELTEWSDLVWLFDDTEMGSDNCIGE